MVTVEYCKEGYAVNDFELELVFQFFLDVSESLPDEEEPWKYSTENIFNRIRLGIARGEILFPVQFKFEDKIFTPNKYGAITDWPNGFCDSNIRMCEEILKTALKARWENKK